MKELRVLNRIVRWHDGKGVTYEPDPRHAALVVKQMNVESTPSVKTPGTKIDVETAEANLKDMVLKKTAGTFGKRIDGPQSTSNSDPELVGTEAAQFRAIVARAFFSE